MSRRILVVTSDYELARGRLLVGERPALVVKLIVDQADRLSPHAMQLHELVLTHAGELLESGVAGVRERPPGRGRELGRKFVGSHLRSFRFVSLPYPTAAAFETHRISCTSAIQRGSSAGPRLRQVVGKARARPRLLRQRRRARVGRGR